MKTKTIVKSVVVLVVISVCVYFSFFKQKATNDRQSSKPFLTVNEAKVKAFQNTESFPVNNLKGILVARQKDGSKSFYYLEDAEPAGMDDVPLYCSFSQASESYLQSVEPGTELILSGVLTRKGNAAEVSDCSIICINKGTLEQAQFGYKF
jgi:hypothetical protein